MERRRRVAALVVVALACAPRASRADAPLLTPVFVGAGVGFERVDWARATRGSYDVDEGNLPLASIEVPGAALAPRADLPSSGGIGFRARAPITIALSREPGPVLSIVPWFERHTLRSSLPSDRTVSLEQRVHRTGVTLLAGWMF